MQPNLKPNYQKYQHLLLTLSNLQGRRGEQQNQPCKQGSYLLNSNITHSRMTNAQRIINNEHLFQDNQSQQQNVMECPTCSIWKRWAVEQQINLLRLEETIIQKQNALGGVMLQLTAKLSQKEKVIQMYNEELLKCKDQIASLNSQIKENHQRFQSQMKEITQNHEVAYKTPLKNNNSHRAGISVKMSQLTDDKKGSTAATKPQLEWSAYQTNLEKFKPFKEVDITKLQFENKMLKEYNSVLLQRLKESKYRKPF